MTKRAAAHLAAAFLISALGSGCRRGVLRGDVYEKREVTYRLGPLPADLEVVNLHGNDVALTTKTSAHAMAVNSTCGDHGDPPLEVLTQHLMFGFTNRHRLSAEPGTLDGRACLKSHYTAELDGVPMELLLVVMKKNDCVFDFSYLAPQGRLEEKRASFEAMVAGFQLLERR